MKSVAKVVLSLMLAAMIAVPLMAQEEPKKPKRAPKKPAGPAVSILKQLEKAELTDEQKAKVKELAAKLPRRDAAIKITPEQRKAVEQAMKKAKAEGKSGREMAEVRNSVLKLTDEQKAAMKKAQEARSAVMKEIMALLTPEQREKAGIKGRGARDPSKKRTGERKGGGKKKQKQEE